MSVSGMIEGTVNLNAESECIRDCVHSDRESTAYATHRFFLRERSTDGVISVVGQVQKVKNGFSIGTIN